ncbi:hypothetical protein FRC11_001284, partial [Ceratobasidium sp. 423]
LQRSRSWAHPPGRRRSRESINQTRTESQVRRSSPIRGNRPTEDTPLDPQAPRLVSQVCETVPKVVGDHTRKGKLPPSLGGDHSF